MCKKKIKNTKPTSYLTFLPTVPPFPARASFLRTARSAEMMFCTRLAFVVGSRSFIYYMALESVRVFESRVSNPGVKR